ncbi:unnamed protein product [Caenorhabditis bovis]|uniref:N-acetylgalactosaminide beta-1,3-galactosyltransferase n=1 Tax=Caenorhabditis bovis TaxID=2654633 RepID=A0A8S1F6E6_9PELO|nr:unnamed protein product [Caenorhabditis bovis]
MRLLIAIILVSLRFADSADNSTPSILCLIHTATPSHETRAKTILETWAKRCDDYLLFTDSPMNTSIPHIYWPLLTSRDHSWEKIRRVFKHVHTKITKKYDFYLRADDDAYILMHNVRKFVANYSPTDPHYFGFRWRFFTTHGFADGSAYILTQPTVEAFNEVMLDPAKCPDHHRAEEDQELAKCLGHVGIYPEDIRDNNGSERIQHFHPLEQYVMCADAFGRRNAYYPLLKGEENFSPEMISFHHVSPYEMRLLDYIFYTIDK